MIKEKKLKINKPYIDEIDLKEIVELYDLTESEIDKLQNHNFHENPVFIIIQYGINVTTGQYCQYMIKLIHNPKDREFIRLDNKIYDK